jgi:hypothetical protein
VVDELRVEGDMVEEDQVGEEDMGMGIVPISPPIHHMD